MGMVCRDAQPGLCSSGGPPWVVKFGGKGYWEGKQASK